VGRFWQPRIEFASVLPEAFAAFDEPIFGKVAWSLSVAPRGAAGAWITVDLRVAFTDAAAQARFRPYWALIGQFSHAMRRSLLRLCKRELGPDPDRARRLPGDELLTRPSFQRTHAVDIEVPMARVWPWLLQIGADRAGWYSWDRLDNGDVQSANRIIAELQHLEVGQIIHGLPKARGGFAVLRIDEGRTVVLGSPSLLPSGAPRGLPPEPPYRMTWAFALEPIGAGATHLAVRVRGSFEPGPALAILLPALVTAHEIMQWRQLYNLKRRAEHIG
jgi:proline iminopeptidase